MSKHYDEKGNQSGWTDENGRHYDEKGNFSGWTDQNGRHYDEKGNFSGWTDEKGRHRDDKGNFSGWTDEKGRHRDGKGNFSGWTESSSTTTSSSTSSTSSSTSRDGSSSSGSGGGLEILFAIIAIASAVIGIAIAASPIIAPILLTKIETARKKGDFGYVKEWTSWGLTASVTAILVVLVAGGAIGFEITTLILGLTASSTSSILTQFIYIVAITTGIISFALLFITGISPTALIYLKNKESYLLSTGEVVKAQNLRQYSSMIKTTAISTVILAVAIFVIIPLVSATTKWVSTKIQASVLPPPTAVQNLPIISEPTKIMFTSTPAPITAEILFTPTVAPTNHSLDLTGIWDMNFSYYGYTNSNGVFENRSATENWSINLQQFGNNLTGEILSVNSKYTDTCINGTIEGTINNSEFSLLVYFHGSCCPNEIVRIDGRVENNNMTGIYQPHKIPSGTCTLSTGDMIGTRH